MSNTSHANGEGGNESLSEVDAVELAEPLDQSASSRSPARIRTEQRAVGALVSVIGLYVLLFELSRHAVAANSDSATVALEGHAMLSGNVLLSGWTISLDSFWSIDALFNAVVTGLLGLRDSVVNVVPAVIATVVIAFGVVIAGWGLDRRSRVIASIVVIAMLGLPSHALSFFFLQGPWHVGTALWCLIAFFALRHGRFGWSWLVAVVFLGVGLLGDVQILALGVAPVFLAGCAAALRTRSIRRALATVSAAPAACLLAVGVRELALRIGTFTYHEAHHTAKLKTIGHNASHLAHWGGALLGVINGPYGGPTISPWFSSAHLIAVVILLATVVVSLWALLHHAGVGADRNPGDGELWRIDDLLLFGIFGDLGAFFMLTLSNNILYARYLTVAVIFAVLLAARVIARTSRLLRAGRPQIVIGTAAVALVVLFGVQVGDEFSSPQPVQPVVALDRFLAAHHLSHGIGDYWAASIVTLETNGAIEVRPVVANLHHLIVPDGRQADSAWYRDETFSFLVYQSLPYGRVDAATVAKTFGAPAHLYQVGEYYVATWSHPLTLSKIPFP